MLFQVLAAVAFARAINNQQAPLTKEAGPSTTAPGHSISSPMKAVQLRIKNYKKIMLFMTMEFGVWWTKKQDIYLISLVRQWLSIHWNIIHIFCYDICFDFLDAKSAVRKSPCVAPCSKNEAVPSVLHRTSYSTCGICNEVFNARLGWWLLGYNHQRLRARGEKNKDTCALHSMDSKPAMKCVAGIRSVNTTPPMEADRYSRLDVSCGRNWGVCED